MASQETFMRLSKVRFRRFLLACVTAVVGGYTKEET